MAGNTPCKGIKAAEGLRTEYESVRFEWNKVFNCWHCTRSGRHSPNAAIIKSSDNEWIVKCPQGMSFSATYQELKDIAAFIEQLQKGEA